MHLNRYQEEATRTLLPSGTLLPSAKGREALNLGALGLGGEAGEAIDLIKKHLFHDQPLDLPKLRKELGDVLWYVACLATGAGFTLEEVAEANVAKADEAPIMEGRSYTNAAGEVVQARAVSEKFVSGYTADGTGLPAPFDLAIETFRKRYPTLLPEAIPPKPVRETRSSSIRVGHTNAPSRATRTRARSCPGAILSTNRPRACSRPSRITA